MSEKQIIKVAFHVDRKLAIAAGYAKYGVQVIEIDLDDLTEEERQVLAAHGDASPCDCKYDLQLLKVWIGHSYFKLPETAKLDLDHVRQCLKAIGDEEKRIAAEEAARKKAEEAEAAQAAFEILHAPTEELLLLINDNGEGLWQLKPSLSQNFGNFPEAQKKREELRSLVGERNKALRAERAAKAAQEKAEKEAEAKAKREAQKAKCEAWIMENGSARLRRNCEEGFEYMAIYRDERLAIDAPGWVFRDDFAFSASWEEKEPRNVSEFHLNHLDAGRKHRPNCYLAYVEYSDRDEDDEDDRYYEDDEDNESQYGYFLVDEFLGKKIIFGPLG